MGIMEIFKNTIQDAVRDSKVKTAVELGVEHGESTLFILEALGQTGGELYSYDPADCSKVSASKKWHFQQVNGAEGFLTFHNTFPKKQIDFLFVDTDPHSFDQTYLWCITWFSLLKKGGISLWHDTELIRGGVGVRDALEFYAKHNKVELEFIKIHFGMGVMKKI